MEAEIIIERSPMIVWKYFTNHRNWEKWWGGGMKSAQWHKGGKLVWDLGGSSEVLDIIPGKEVIICGSWMDTTWEFEASGPNSTKVLFVETAPRGGAYFTNGGVSNFSEMKQTLKRLKECIEKETIESPSGKQHSIKNCLKCGTENPEDAIFCVGCGEKLEAYPEPEEETQPFITEEIEEPEIKTMKCLYCGEDNPEDAVFCVSCGEKLGEKVNEMVVKPGEIEKEEFKIRCTKCSTLNRPEAEYCNACGKPLIFEYAGVLRRFGAVFIDGINPKYM